MSKIMVHFYSTDKTNNQFSIGYMINPSLKCNNLFRVQVEQLLILSFDARKMETIKYCLRKNNTCVVAIIIIYENNVEKNQNIIEY